MCKALWVFPMAGRGTRTSSKGCFKPFIEICGIKMVQWFLHSIKNNFDDGDLLVFITNPLYYNEYSFDAIISSILAEENIKCKWAAIAAEQWELGQAYTVYAAKDYIKDAKLVISANSDQFINFTRPLDLAENEGFITINADLGDTKSFVKIEQGRIMQVREKENISNIACTGIYAAGNGDAYLEALEKMFADKFTVNGEYYITPALDYMINNTCYFFRPVETPTRYDLGTVRGIEAFTSLKDMFDSRS